MNDQITEFLKKHKRAKIELVELEKASSEFSSYEDFYFVMKELEIQGVLIPIQSAGTNGKGKALANRYRLDLQELCKEDRRQITEMAVWMYKDISLEEYFSLPIEEFLKDKGEILLVNEYLKKQGIVEGKFFPELSFEITGNEKWIEKGKGRQILTRLKLWDKFQIQQSADPVAFAVNTKIRERDIHYHLIMENKTPFLHAMDALSDSDFSTLIYGQGWKIVAGLELFKKQFASLGEHIFYYFGDIDKSGIAIYHFMKERYEVRPALQFYQALFMKKTYEGKEAQNCKEEVIKSFILDVKEGFEDDRPNYILKMLEEGRYQPQEILGYNEITELMKRK